MKTECAAGRGRSPENVAELLLRSQAVTLNVRSPYRYASGIWSPIYCDNRMLLSFPDRREIVTEAFCERIRTIHPVPQVVAGVATAGIAWAAWIADRCALPLIYVRGAAKTHGKGRQIEGVVSAGSRTVVIEDLLSTGASAAAAVEALRAAELEVSACLAVFSYQLPACNRKFERLGCPAMPLTTFEVMMTTAGRLGVLEPDDLETARSWNRDPETWGQLHGA